MAVLHALLLIVSVALLAAYVFLKRMQTYWTRRGIPAAANPHILYGNVAGMGSTKFLGNAMQEVYVELKNRGLAFGGFTNFIAPTVMIVDPELVKHVVVKDFHVFHDRGFYVDEENDPLSGHLFNLEGAKWKVMRQKLSPTFTSGKMKMMFGTVLNVAQEMVQFFEKNYHREDLQIQDILKRFTTDVIGNVAFGIECNTMENPDSDFRRMGNKAFQVSTFDIMKTFIGMQFKPLARLLQLKQIDSEVERFFLELTKSTVALREQQAVQRNDFLKLLLEIKNQGKLSDDPNSAGSGLTIQELAAQCFVFFLAGFETSSTTMNFCLYELALNPDVQDRLRGEIKQALDGNKGVLTYEMLMKMDYLDRVVNETLRKHPPLANIFRINNTDYKMPGSNHVIPAGSLFQVAMFAMQHDPDHFPNPERFDPDRFLPEAVAARHPYCFVPFGEGPRICIGLRFGVMQAKIGLVALLSKFKFSPNARTPIPMVYEPKSVTTTPISGMYLKIERVK